MPRKKLTEAACKRLQVPKGKNREDYFDALLPGLCFKVTNTNRIWSVVYRPKAGPKRGIQRRYTIGPYPAFSLKDAREEAQKVLRQVSRGEDPQAEKDAAKAAARDTAPPNDAFASVADDFIARHVSKVKPRTADEYRRPIEQWLKPRWGDRPIGEITRREIRDLIDDVADGKLPVPVPTEGKTGRRAPRPNRKRGGVIAARRTYATVRKLFSWAAARDIIDASPAIIPAEALPGKETPRDRFLTDDEIVALWPALEAAAYPFGDAFKLMLLTGQRRNEIAAMRWSEIDLEAKTWNLPAERTKAGRAHLVPLSPQVVTILENAPRFVGDDDAPDGEFVFSTRGGIVPISGLSKAKAAVAERAGIDHWTLHDLRRTLSTR
ncbi:MAG: tyrosine-type recombinase/integrase, partial [Alphaproteobacteria bacterium]|nr:tyrosine-type recombinase/integrase [Alphaproteobacteria bacterium]